MITFTNIQIRRGIKVLLDKANATINPGEKVGLVGMNGCGKSTLLSLLKNEISCDAGQVAIPPHWTLAWVNQETPALAQPALEYIIDGDSEFRQTERALAEANARNDGATIARLNEQLDAIDAWRIHARAASLLHGLGFSQQQLSHSVSQFSGGWRMRLNLAQALIVRSELLLLDEPTNHLDLDTIIWVERWLRSYQGTLIVISHDRDFLDAIANKILHIEQRTLFSYSGNYSDFERMRAVKLTQQQALYRSQQQKVAHLESYVNRFRAIASKAKQAQSRLKMLERMTLVAAAHVDKPFQFHFFPPKMLPNPLLDLAQVAMGYANHIVINRVQFKLAAGARIGLLGRNGAGKSTLMKLLAGKLQPLTGKITLAKGVVIGYFAQHQLESLRCDESPLQHMTRAAANATEQQLRDYLGRFGFQQHLVNAPVANFSGGEKTRLALALIIWQRPNLLLLDEPTNHLDLDMRQALTEALLDFTGAMVIISHDRHLLRAVTDEFYLVHEGNVTPFAGDLDDYQHWLNDLNKQGQRRLDNQSTASQRHDRKDEKRRQAAQRAQTLHLRKQLEKLEAEMARLQLALTQIEQRMSDNTLYLTENKQQLAETLTAQVATKRALEQCETDWLTLSEQI